MKITTILKRDGRKQKFDREKISVAIWKALFAVGRTTAAETTVWEKQLDKTSSRWKQAGRLAEIVEGALINSNGSHQWKVEEIQDVVEQVLLAAGNETAAQAYILYRNRRAAQRSPLALSPYPLALGDNLGMSENAYAAMAKRYLWKDKDGNIIETPKQAMERVAVVVAKEEGKGKREEGKNEKYWKDKYLEIMTSFEFVPAGCYFRGAGNKQNGSLANCFVLPVEDSIEKIFDAVKWAALIHQMGGGTGFNFSHLRPRGDIIRSGGLSSGPINFMKAFDAETQIVMQGGEHRGANMGILNVDHPDVFEFIRAKSIDGEISNFNISVGAFDGFMKAVENGNNWALKNPRDKSIVQNIPAGQLWEEIINLAHKTGDPGMIYLDAVNRVNPVLKSLGPIESTNVCGEQPLHPFDVCNLGSINLAKFVVTPWWEKIPFPSSRGVPIQSGRRGDLGIATLPPVARNDINWRRLEEVVRTAVRFLDDGIDASTYPIPQITDMAHRLRRIGLGVMGWADMLVKLGVRYDSDEGIKLAESIMKFIQQISWDESHKLSKEKGAFLLWGESCFNSAANPFGEKRQVRNVAVTTIAPTGTISMIADCSSGIEPYFALEYTKNVVDKKGLKYTNKYYVEAKKAVTRLTGYQDKQVKKVKKNNDLTFQPFNLPTFLSSIFRTSHQIFPDWHVKMQAAFQKYTDNAVSKTINFSHEATVRDVEKAYILAWKLGCKGITVYRDGSRKGQILRIKDKGTLSPQPLALSPKLVQSQMKITPLSQRAYQVERRQITEDLADGHCPECGAVMEESEGCSLCRNCGFSKCSL